MAKTPLEKSIALTARRGKDAAARMMNASVPAINNALGIMAKLLKKNKSALIRENKKDCTAARNKGLSDAMIDRLTLSDKTFTSMIKGLQEVARIPSPIGKTYDTRTRPNGLRIYKTRVPIGVIGIIYESRPNVTVDAAAICLKSQNAVILRGGSESFYSNRALASLFSQALYKAGLPRQAVQLVPTTNRRAVELLLTQTGYIDLIIPRGGEALITMVVENSHIPVIKHYKGVCHIYVSRLADMKQALPIVVNAKVQRPGVCNAMETLILDARLSKKNKCALVSALIDNGVTLYGDAHIRSLHPAIKPAKPADWEAEYLDLRCAVKSVRSLQEAVTHINTYGSGHTDAILSTSSAEIKQFVSQVDSSSVMVNASTRFSDGGEYGMGCEIGISTDKLHARGPMGVEDLTTYKWIVEGDGQVRK